VAGDLDDRGHIDRALTGCDTVVHLAYSDGWQTRRLVEACRRHAIKRFVHMSSIAVHGADPGPECAHEATARIGRYPGEEYSNLKAAAEQVLKRAIDAGLDAVILRPPIVYGPYGPFVSSIVDTARDTGVFTLLDEGRGVRNAVYVDDLCDAIRAAIHTERGRGHGFFVTGDPAVTWRDFNPAFARMVVPPPRIRSVGSEAVRRYWASRRLTLKSNLIALRRLTTSADFHRRLATVPAIDAFLKGGKRVVKLFLSSERLGDMRALRHVSSRSDEGPAGGVQWPDLGRVTREWMRIEFSNERARTGWLTAWWGTLDRRLGRGHDGLEA
jgi:nucleoside-diphosphate-sugar epimerase